MHSLTTTILSIPLDVIKNYIALELDVDSNIAFRTTCKFYFNNIPVRNNYRHLVHGKQKRCDWFGLDSKKHVSLDDVYIPKEIKLQHNHFVLVNILKESKEFRNYAISVLFLLKNKETTIYRDKFRNEDTFSSLQKQLFTISDRESDFIDDEICISHKLNSDGSLVHLENGEGCTDRDWDCQQVIFPSRVWSIFPSYSRAKVQLYASSKDGKLHQAPRALSLFWTLSETLESDQVIIDHSELLIKVKISFFKRILGLCVDECWYPTKTKKETKKELNKSEEDLRISCKIYEK